MLDTFRSENAQDFNQRFVKCFGWYLDGKGKEIPVYLSHIRDSRLHFTGLDGMDYHTYADAGIQFKFLPIRKAIYYGRDGNFYCLQRHPARQWRRGMCQDNTNVFLLTHTGPIQLNLNLEIVSNIFQDNLKSPNLLGTQFCIVKSIVYLYDKVIGSFAGDTLTLVKGYEIFQQDIIDALRANQLNYKVKTNA